MTETPHQERVDGPGDGPEDTRRIDTDHLRDYRALRRSPTDRKVAGVAGGLGRHLNIDPTILRVAFVVLCFFGGAGLVLYGAAWLLVPEEGRAHSIAATGEGTRNVLLIVAAVFAGLLFLGDSWGGFGFPWPLAIIALVVFVVLMNRDKPMQTAGATAGPGAPSWAPPTAPAYQPPPPRPDRGPKLFWVTVALLAIALGILWLFELGGAAVVASAYPALALAIIGAMLVLSAWFGRGGGLILLGLVAAFALAVTSLAAPDWDGDQRRLEATPASAAEVRDSYYVPAGRIYLDLTEVQDLEGLDGDSIDVRANAGELVVVIPDGLDVDIDANVAAAGEAQLLDQSYNGLGIDAEEFVDGGDGVPAIDLNLDLVVGSIHVREQ